MDMVPAPALYRFQPQAVVRVGAGLYGLSGLNEQESVECVQD